MSTYKKRRPDEPSGVLAWLEARATVSLPLPRPPTMVAPSERSGSVIAHLLVPESMDKAGNQWTFGELVLNAPSCGHGAELRPARLYPLLRGTGSNSCSEEQGINSDCQGLCWRRTGNFDVISSDSRLVGRAGRQVDLTHAPTAFACTQGILLRLIERTRGCRRIMSTARHR
jgi:hypothetical protein